MRLTSFSFVLGARGLWPLQKSRHQSNPHGLELFSFSNEARQCFTYNFHEEVQELSGALKSDNQQASLPPSLKTFDSCFWLLQNRLALLNLKSNKCRPSLPSWREYRLDSPNSNMESWKRLTQSWPWKDECGYQHTKDARVRHDHSPDPCKGLG